LTGIDRIKQVSTDKGLGRVWVEILGLDPLYVANEGKLLALVASDAAEPLLRRMRENPYGLDACVIGEVKREPQGIVAMRTGFGGTRIVDMLVGEQLPRIC
jgi:hydrogenase expression/formation protein HypE